MNLSRVIIGAIAAIALAGGGFVAGVNVGVARTGTAASPAPSDAGRGGQFTVRQGQGGAAGQLGGAVNGRVISVNADSITVEVRQPGQAGASPATTSTIVLVGGTTRLVRTTEADITLADIKAGDSVTVVGQIDAATGTLAANAIVVGGNALQQLFGPPGGAGAAPQGSGRPATPRPSPTR
jgi:hypothetical protein